MRKTAPKKIKNSTLMALFFLLVFVAIIISVIVKIVSLITHSTVDNHHQFILEIRQQNHEEQIAAFNRGTNTIVILHVKGVKNPQDIQSLEIPIDAQLQSDHAVNPANISSELFTAIVHCTYPACQNLNSVDALKLYLFAKHLKQHAIQDISLSLPLSQTDLKTTIPSLFIDDTLYHEALSISVINASGEVGLGNKVSQLITNVGGNVVSVTSAEAQDNTTMQSTFGKGNYSLQRLQKILHLQSQQMQRTGISDIIITIGRNHPKL